VAQSVVANNRPVSIAGDCCASIGVLAGLQRVGLNPTLIWFDAHGDFNTWETTPSGFLGGMPLAMLAGLGDQTLVEGVGLNPLPEAQIILTDGRDLDPGERELLNQSQVVHLSSVESLMEAPLPDSPLYVHFDTDVINPAEAPAMNYRTPGGPSVAVLRKVFRQLAATGRIRAVSMSTWNPELDHDGRSRQASMDLLNELLL
jgi:arginase